MFECPSSITVEPESGFHSRIVPSSLPVTTKLHRAETCMHTISERCSCITCFGCRHVLRAGGMQR